MIKAPRVGELTPAKIAVIYVVAGGAWILVTDYLVTVSGPGIATQRWLQTAKGLIYVGGSAVLVFGLARYRERELGEANERLQRAIRQNSIFHRILRHNLRNTCNIIYGHAQMLKEELGDDPHTDVIRDQSARLGRMVEKTRYLRQGLLGHSEVPAPVDLVREARLQVDACREKYPDAVITTDMTESAWVVASSVDVLVREFLENAIEHNDSGDARVELSVSSVRDGPVRFDVRDNGPGIPAVEREALAQDVEQPLVHSQGIGLWVAKSIVTEADGTLTVHDNEPAGSLIRVELPRAAPPDGN